MNIKLILFGLFTNNYPRELKKWEACCEKTTLNDRRVCVSLHRDYVRGSRGFGCGNSLGKSRNTLAYAVVLYLYYMIHMRNYIYNILSISHGTADGTARL